VDDRVRDAAMRSVCDASAENDKQAARATTLLYLRMLTGLPVAASRSLRAAAVAAEASWGDRPKGEPPEQQLVEKTLLSPDLLIFVFESLRLELGLRSMFLGGVCATWRDMAARRRDSWRLLRVLRGFFMHTVGEAALASKFSASCMPLNWPTDVCALPGGAVCIVDRNNGRLQILSPAEPHAPVYTTTGVINRRTLRRSPPGPPTGVIDPYVFKGDPFGVACAGDHLFVSDSGHHVHRLSLAQPEVGAASIGAHSAGRKDSQFNFPTGLCVCGDTLYVCDYFNHRVAVLGTDLVWRYSFGREGWLEGQFRYPVGIAAHGGEVFVADDTHRVQVFSLGADSRPALPRRPTAWQAAHLGDRMQFRRAIGGQGDAPGRFKEPRGLAIVRGLLVVSEAQGRRVQVLTLEGVPLQVLSLDSSGLGLRGLCVATDGRVWVVDKEASKVHVLEVDEGGSVGDAKPESERDAEKNAPGGV